MGPNAEFLPLDVMGKQLAQVVPDTRGRGSVLFAVEFLKRAGTATDVDNLVLTIVVVCAKINIGIQIEKLDELIGALVGKCATGEKALQVFRGNPILQKIISTRFRARLT